MEAGIGDAGSMRRARSQAACLRPGAGPALVALLLVSTSGTPALVQEAASRGLERCARLSASEARLRCYDAVGAPSAQPKPPDPYRPIGLSAFKSERAGLLTQRVLVRGRLGWLGDFGTLRSEVGMDNEPVWINIARLSPQRLRSLKEQCPRRCLAAVSGSVGHVFSGIGLAADGIEVAP